MSDLEVDIVLDILSNNYRREILRLLSVADCYAFELAKVLQISQRAVTKHLKFLEETGLVISEKRPSSKGPEREYYMLNKTIVLSFILAPNLFQSSIRRLTEDQMNKPQITPALQLDPPKPSNLIEALKEGQKLLPEILANLDVLAIQQSRLLRAYQGVRSHIIDILENNDVEANKQRVLLHLVENDGVATKDEIERFLGKISNLDEILSELEDDGIISTIMLQDNNRVQLKVQLI